MDQRERGKMNRKRAKFWGKNERELNVRTKK